jgi:type IV pilus assembly protein PilW
MCCACPRMPGQRIGQRGMTLVELLIAMVIGLVMMLAVLGTYSLVSKSFGNVSKSNTQVDNARIALQVISQDLEMAGYWGGRVPDFDNLTLTTAPSDAPTAIPDLCLSYSSTNWDATYKSNLMGVPVYSAPASSAPASCNTLLSSLRSATDILAVRRLSSCTVNTTASTTPPCTETEVAGALYMAVNRCTDTSTTIAPYVLDTTGHSAMLQRNCTTANERRRFMSTIYFIRDYANSSGDGIPTLMRSQFGVSTSGGTTTPTQQAAQPLVEGVDMMRVEWGLDLLSESAASVVQDAAVSWTNTTYTVATNRGDGVPDSLNVRCNSSCTAYQLSNAVVATVYILVRSPDAAPDYTDNHTYTLGSATFGPYNDHYHRHVYASTVRLSNVAGRRETP